MVKIDNFIWFGHIWERNLYKSIFKWYANLDAMILCNDVWVANIVQATASEEGQVKKKKFPKISKIKKKVPQKFQKIKKKVLRKFQK